MKKKLYSAVLALFLSAAVADAKVVLTYNIDYMDKAKTLSELIPEEEKYTVDSISISGYFDVSNFVFLHDCTINGRLTGIDLSGAQILEIPDMAFGDESANAAPRKAGNMYGPSKLQYIRLPKMLRRIGYRAFMSSSLRSITIPKVYEIGEAAFSDCRDLREVTMTSYVPPRSEVANAFLSIPEDAVLKVPVGARAAYSSLATYARFGSIEEKEGLYNTGGYFVRGQALRDMMGAGMLDTDSVKIGGTLTEDDIYTLCDCVYQGRLSGIDLSDCILQDNEMPDMAFVELSTIRLQQSHLNWVRLPEGLERIGMKAFGGSFLYSLDLPSTLRYMDSECFMDATINGDVIIPEGVEEINSGAFYEATVTGDIHLPSTLSKVGSICFRIKLDNDSLYMPKNFYINRMTPPEYISGKKGGKLFPGKLPQASNWTLYVPVGAKAAFAANTDWGKFPNIVETPELDGGTSAIGGVRTEDAAVDKEQRIYTLDGRYVGKNMDRLGKGVYVVGGQKVVR